MRSRSERTVKVLVKDSLSDFAHHLIVDVNFVSREVALALPVAFSCNEQDLSIRVLEDLKRFENFGNIIGEILDLTQDLE